MSKETTTPKTEANSYYFPEIGVSVQASNIDEAIKKAKGEK